MSRDNSVNHTNSHTSPVSISFHTIYFFNYCHLKAKPPLLTLLISEVLFQSVVPVINLDPFQPPFLSSGFAYPSIRYRLHFLANVSRTFKYLFTTFYCQEQRKMQWVNYWWMINGWSMERSETWAV